MQAWKRKKSLFGPAKYQCVFEPIEREILGNLAATVANALMERAQSAPRDELAELTGMPSGHKDAPDDPSLARLLPDFEREGDEEYEGDNSLLRSLHESDITKGKLINLAIIGQALGPDGSVNVTITEDEADAWLSGINDLRLYLAAIDADDPVRREERDNLVDWLAYNQGTLLDAMGHDIDMQ